MIDTVNVVMDTAILQNAQKLVVFGQDYAEPLSAMRSLIVALLEKVVAAQGLHQNEADDTSDSYIRHRGEDVLELVDVNEQQGLLF